MSGRVMGWGEMWLSHKVLRKFQNFWFILCLAGIIFPQICAEKKQIALMNEHEKMAVQI
jgi:hypothetical protein